MASGSELLSLVSSVLCFTAGVAAELQTWAVHSRHANGAINPLVPLISTVRLSEPGPKLAGSVSSLI